MAETKRGVRVRATGTMRTLKAFAPCAMLSSRAAERTERVVFILLKCGL